MEIALVCTADAGYVTPLAVMLRSVIANLRAVATLSVYAIDGGIPRQDKERLARFTLSHDVPLYWLDPPAARVARLPIWGRMPSTTYHRLSVAQLLPRELSKVIWLDCDLVLTVDVGRLWETDLAGRECLAVQDMLVPYVSSLLGIRRWRDLGLPRDAKYFNAGVMLIDLDRWREIDYGGLAARYLRSHRREVLFWDQEGLNAVLCGKWGELDPRWNQNASVSGRSFFRADHLNPETYRLVVDDPWVVHFSGNVKPWLMRDTGVWPRSLWFRYLDETPWAGWKPERTLVSVLVEAYESSRIRNVLYPAEAWATVLMRNRAPRLVRG